LLRFTRGERPQARERGPPVVVGDPARLEAVEQHADRR
jgi:hypothetical protein